MKITVTWVNRNANADGHHIYRSTTPISADALPTPLASVPGSATQYVDTNVKRGDKFYYRVGTYKGADFALSTEMQGTALPHSGPGPAELLYGDYEAGYFGVLEAHELVSGPELKNLLGHQLNAGAADQKWAKVAHKGKILYIPLGSGFGYPTWQQLYQNGLVYGTDDDGPAAAVSLNGVGVNQLKTFSKFGSTFKVRCLKGAPDDGIFGYVGPNGDWAPVGLEDSEFNHTILRMAFGIYEGKHGIVIPGVTAADIGAPNYQYGTVRCQELLEGGRSLVRGFYNYVGGNFPNFGAATTTAFNSGVAAALGGTTYAMWRPVLELMDN
jgi:hypothetical protein